MFREDVALALIDRAEEEYVAVASVEPICERDLPAYETPRGPSLTAVQCLRSWSSAREFVKDLSGRNLYFDVVFEPWSATYLARLRYLFRTGASWSRGAGGEGSAIQ